MLNNFVIFFVAAFFEIFGCYAFWLYFRMDKASVWLIVGVLSLITFAYSLTKIDVENAGRVYAIYGGIYILCSFIWLVVIEKENFNKYDILGVSISLLGALIIFMGNKSS